MGPWSADILHGGPLAALGVRACEQACRGDESVSSRPCGAALRANVEFLTPARTGRLDIRSRVVRTGRRSTLAEAEISVGSKCVLLARTWMLRATVENTPASARAVAVAAADPTGLPPDPLYRAPGACPPAMTDWAFPYARAIEWRRVSGEPGSPEAAVAWARQRIPLLPDEEPTSLQRAVLVGGSAYGISAAYDWDRWSFVNVDLTVHLSRRIEGEWVLLDARTRYERIGTGLTTSTLHDENGIVGTGSQSLLVYRLAGSGSA